MPEVRDCGRVVDIYVIDVDIDVCDIGVDDVSDVDVDIDVCCVDVWMCGDLWWWICGGGFVVGICGGDLSYHNRVSTTHYCFFIIATPHSQYLRH